MSPTPTQRSSTRVRTLPRLQCPLSKVRCPNCQAVGQWTYVGTVKRRRASRRHYYSITRRLDRTAQETAVSENVEEATDEDSAVPTSSSDDSGYSE